MEKLSTQDQALLEATEKDFYIEPNARAMRDRIETFVKNRDAKKYLNDFEQWQYLGLFRPNVRVFQNHDEFADFCKRYGVRWGDQDTESYVEENWRQYSETSEVFLSAGIKTTLAVIHDEFGVSPVTLLDVDSLRSIVGEDYRVIAQLWGDWFESCAKQVESLSRGHYLLNLKMADLLRSVL